MNRITSLLAVAFMACATRPSISFATGSIISHRVAAMTEPAIPGSRPSHGMRGAGGPVLRIATPSEGSIIRADAALGKLSMLPGVNLSGLEGNAGTRPGRVNYNYVQPSNAMLDYYAAKGIKVIRLPFLWERVQPDLLAKPASMVVDAAYLQLIENVLVHAQADGMGVVIDMHNYGAYDGIKIGAAGGVTTAGFGAAWQAIAGLLKTYPALLGYDLMNEPNKMPSAAVWPAAAQAAVTAIRRTDMHTAIFVEGDSYAAASSWQTVNGKLAIVDPASLIIYEAHVYGDRDSSGTHYAWNTEATYGVTVNTIAQRVGVFDGWCRSGGHMCVVGEVGIGNDSSEWNVELANGLARMKADGLLAAFYWAGGPWWGSYPMSIEPKNGIDSPQMGVMSSLDH